MKILPQDIAQLPDFDRNLMMAIDQVCSVTEWDYGEVWIPEENDRILNLSPLWCVNTHNQSNILELEQFWECSKESILSPGEGLPGRVWVSKEVEWIADVSAKSETYFLRNKIAAAFGVKAGLGVPIIVKEQVESILVFFMLNAREKDDKLIEQTLTIIANLVNQDEASDDRI